MGVGGRNRLPESEIRDAGSPGGPSYLHSVSKVDVAMGGVLLQQEVASYYMMCRIRGSIGLCFGNIYRYICLLHSDAYHEEGPETCRLSCVKHLHKQASTVTAAYFIYIVAAARTVLVSTDRSSRKALDPSDRYVLRGIE
jgi:hypothetical protein